MMVSTEVGDPSKCLLDIEVDAACAFAEAHIKADVNLLDDIKLIAQSESVIWQQCSETKPFEIRRDLSCSCKRYSSDPPEEPGSVFYLAGHKRLVTIPSLIVTTHDCLASEEGHVVERRS